MTISSTVSREQFAINPSRQYVYTYNHAGADTIDVYEVDGDDELSLINPSLYTNVEGGAGPVHQGGTVTFTSSHQVGTVAVLIVRNTPRTQLVDYEAYGPFPAETHEFALDKLTMIAQEAWDAAVVAAGGGVSGDFIPRAGTQPGLPITGTLEVEDQVTGRKYVIEPEPDFGASLLIDKVNDAQDGSIIVGAWDGSANRYLWTFRTDGELVLPVNIDYDLVEDASAVPKGWIEDLIVGGVPPNTYLQMAGTAASGDNMSGAIVWEDTTNGKLFSISEESGFHQSLIIQKVADSESGSIVIGAWDGVATLFLWTFRSDGDLVMPAIDYDLVEDASAVPKGWIKDNFPQVELESKMSWGCVESTGAQLGGSTDFSVVKQPGNGHYRITFNDAAFSLDSQAIAVNLLIPSLATDIYVQNVSTTVVDVFTYQSPPLTLFDSRFLFHRMARLP
jgi:hypothetical protein